MLPIPLLCFVGHRLGTDHSSVDHLEQVYTASAWHTFPSTELAPDTTMELSFYDIYSTACRLLNRGACNNGITGVVINVFNVLQCTRDNRTLIKKNATLPTWQDTADPPAHIIADPKPY